MTTQPPYTLFKFLYGGTYTTGTDWKTQFSGATFYCAMPTIGGVATVPGVQTDYGVYAAFALESINPFDSEILILEASSGAPVQVYVNDVLIDEVGAPGEVEVSLLGGINKVEIIRPESPLVMIPAGALIDPKSQTNSWVSLFPRDEDPFSTPSSGAGTKPPVFSGGL